jgi:hypothetical protein
LRSHVTPRPGRRPTPPPGDVEISGLPDMARAFAERVDQASRLAYLPFDGEFGPERKDSDRTEPELLV